LTPALPDGSVLVLPEDFSKYGIFDKIEPYGPERGYWIPLGAKGDQEFIPYQENPRSPLKNISEDLQEALYSRGLITNFETSLETSFRPTDNRVVNIPEVTIAEVATAGALARAEAYDKAPKKKAGGQDR
jgi:hypothetical protein